jgi:hypothetical protein
MNVDENGSSCEKGSKSFCNASGEGASLLRGKSGVVGDDMQQYCAFDDLDN